MTCPSVNIVVVGSSERTEFVELNGWFTHEPAVGRMKSAEDAATFLKSSRTPADWIVIVQSYAGQYTHQQISEIRLAAPLAPIIFVLGQWSEGETRSGDPLPGVWRTPWHQWAVRADFERDMSAASSFGLWGMPATTSEDEKALVRSRFPLSIGRGLVGISAEPYESASAISDACLLAGYATAWMRCSSLLDVSGVSAIVLDVERRIDTEQSRIQVFRERFVNVPLIAIVGFLRPEESRQLRHWGVDEVMSKPYWVDEFLARLNRICNRDRTMVGMRRADDTLQCDSA